MTKDEDSNSALINLNIGADVLGVGKSFETLISALRAGVGPLFDPWLRKRLARSEQAAARDWIDLAREAGLDPTNFELITRDQRAEVRLLAEKDKAQANREAIAFGAVEEARRLLEDDNQVLMDAEVEPEWIGRFWRLSQDISQENLQNLWSRILARQSLGVGLVSARTLEALSTLEGWEIAELTRLAQFLWLSMSSGPPDDLGIPLGFVETVYGTTPANRAMDDLIQEDKTIRGGRVLDHFTAVGIFQAEVWSCNLRRMRESEIVRLSGQEFRIREIERTRRIPKDSEPRVRGYGFTILGRDIVGLIHTEPHLEFVRHVRAGLQEIGYDLWSV